MNVRCCIFVIFAFLWTATQAKSITPESNDLWKPENGTRDEWMRCYGVPCEQWKKAKNKLTELKALTRDNGQAFDYSSPTEEGKTMEDATPNLLDGCILLTEKQIDELLEEQRNSVHDRKKRATTLSNFQRWTVTPIPWKFDGKHTELQRNKIRSAFKHWSEQTCIRFRELGTNERITTNHILVTSDQGCYSHVGMVDLMPQRINLQPDCTREFGTPVHEIGHSLGLWHEQQRWDRDEVVNVLKENLGYYQGQFIKLYNSDLSLPYDLGSVMHYGPKTGSINNLNTMETVNPIYQRNMGQRTGLSFLDAKSINLAYCSASCSNRLARSCERDGYQDPNHCDRCRCPEGFGGTYCHEVEASVNADCSDTLQATSTPQYISSPGYDTDKHYGNRQQCNWVIKAPANHRVVLSFEDEFGIYCHNDGQCHHWVEVRTGVNIGRQGARFCCYRKPLNVLRSEADEMSVVFRTNWTVPWNTAKRGFKAKFYAEPVGGVRTDTTTKKTTTSTTTTTTTAATTTTTTRQAVNGIRSIWRCTFESKSGRKTLCDMQQLTSDDFDWTVQSGPTPSQETGPSSAISDSRPNYIYIEASSPRRFNDQAIVAVPELFSAGQHCVTFDYHMYGYHINELRLATMNTWEELTTVWRKQNNQGDKWLSARVDVNIHSYEQLAFVGLIGHEYSGDIALDNITVMKGRC